MEPTLPERKNDLNPDFVQGLVSAAAAAFAQGTANQADATRTQVDANLKIAAMQQETQHLSMRYSALAIGFILIFAVGIVSAAFYIGRMDVVTHLITAIGSGAAGWFAGKAKK